MIEGEWSVSSVHKRRPNLLRRLRPIRAACAVVLIVFGGLFALHKLTSHIGANPTQTNLVDTTGTLIQNATPFSISAGDWKLVIYKSLERPGPYYDMAVFYVGKKPIYVASSTNSWGGSTSSGGNMTPLEMGDSLGEVADVIRLPRDLAEEPPYKLSWTSSTGQVYKQMFYFSQAKRNMQDVDFHQYMGHNSHWTARYAYETLKGGGISYPFGEVALSYHGRSMPKNMTITFYAPTGDMQWDESGDFANNQILIGVDQSQTGYAATSRKATLTIMSQTTTDTIPLTLQQGN